MSGQPLYSGEGKRAGLQRVNVWAYICMASFHSVVGTVGSFQGGDYLTQQTEQRGGGVGEGAASSS